MRPTEKHYSVQEIAKAWGLHADTIRSLFANEPGVIRINSPEKVRPKKRGYSVMRVPEHVLQRVYDKLHKGEPTNRTKKVRIKRTKHDLVRQTSEDEVPKADGHQLRPLTDSERERLHAIFEAMKHLATPLNAPGANIRPSRFQLPRG